MTAVNTATISFRQRKDTGTWEYRLELPKTGAKRNQKSRSGFKTKRECMQAGYAALAEYNKTGGNLASIDITVSDFLDLWIEEYCKVWLKDTTTDGYVKKIKNHIKPVIGDYYITNVDRLTLQNLIAKKYDDGYSMNTLSSIRGILTKSFEYAYQDMKYIPSNPALGLKLPSGRKKPKVTTRKKKRDYISPETFKKILQRFPEGHTDHIPLQIGYWTGMRIGEVFGLAWSDVDFEQSTISVNRQVQWVQSAQLWQFTPPKYDSYRTIKIDSDLLELLKREKNKQDRYRVFYGKDYIQTAIDENDFLVENKPGKPIDMIMRYEHGDYIQERVTQHMNYIIHTQLNLPNFDFHSLRLSHATLMHELGVDPFTVEKRLGHKSAKVTLQTYTRVTDAMQNAACDALEKIKDAHQNKNGGRMVGGGLK